MAFLRQVALRKCRVFTLLSALFLVNKGWDVEASLEWEGYSWGGKTPIGLWANPTPQLFLVPGGEFGLE